jgi:hypothetical protein
MLLDYNVVNYLPCIDDAVRGYVSILSTTPQKTVSNILIRGLANGKPVLWTRNCRTQY